MRLNTQVQIVCLIFLLLIIANYQFSKRVNTKASRIFRLMLVDASIYMALDFITVIELYYYMYLPEQIINISHMAFFLTIAVYIFLIYFYIECLTAESHKRTRTYRVVCILPLLIAFLGVCFCPIHYHIENETFYSYGVGVDILFSCILFYIILSVTITLKYWKATEKKKRFAVLISCTIMSIVCGIQGIFPGILISSMGIVLTIMCIFISQENPLAFMDSDTGALNHHAFRLASKEYFLKERKFTVLTVIFDDWDMLNTHLGYHMGRKLIRAVTEYMSQVYGMNVYYPYTGAPSLICDRNVAYNIAKQLGEKLNNLNHFEGVDVEINWHICLTDYPSNGVSSDDVEANINFLLNHSMHGLDSSVNHIIMFDEKWTTMFEREEQIVDILKNAIQNDGIQMYYQPIYSSVEREFHSAEALVRLKDTSTIGFISPEEFIPIAERRGLIVDMSMIIFDQVCRFIQEESLEKLGLQYIEVNLSAVHCMDNRLVPQLTSLMNKYGIRPDQLNLEITETTALDVNKYVAGNLGKLIEMGCGFSMDDYGTGYSNLSQIVDMTFDIAKIDKSLVWGYFESTSHKQKVLLSSTVEMFHRLEMQLVAEGVETEEQAEVLKKMGVEYLQGYFYSKPIPPSDFKNFLIKNAAKAS